MAAETGASAWPSGSYTGRVFLRVDVGVGRDSDSGGSSPGVPTANRGRACATRGLDVEVGVEAGLRGLHYPHRGCIANQIVREVWLEGERTYQCMFFLTHTT